MCVLLALVLCSLHLLHGAVPRALGSLGCEHSLHCPSVIVNGLHILHVVSCWVLSALAPERVESSTYCIVLASNFCVWLGTATEQRWWLIESLQRGLRSLRLQQSPLD